MQEVTDGEIIAMQDDVTALAKAWLDRGLPQEAIAGVLTSEGSILMLEMGTPLGILIKTMQELWATRGGNDF